MPGKSTFLMSKGRDIGKSHSEYSSLTFRFKYLQNCYQVPLCTLMKWALYGFIICFGVIGISTEDWTAAFWGSAGMVGFWSLFALFAGDGGDTNSGSTSASNAYKGMSYQQRMEQEKELEELNEQVEDINDRFDC